MEVIFCVLAEERRAVLAAMAAEEAKEAEERKRRHLEREKALAEEVLPSCTG
jgi:hypothetical protein